MDTKQERLQKVMQNIVDDLCKNNMMIKMAIQTYLPTLQQQVTNLTDEAIDSLILQVRETIDYIEG